MTSLDLRLFASRRKAGLSDTDCFWRDSSEGYICIVRFAVAPVGDRLISRDLSCGFEGVTNWPT
jgi:hypothetical protein